MGSVKKREHALEGTCSLFTLYSTQSVDQVTS